MNSSIRNEAKLAELLHQTEDIGPSKPINSDSVIAFNHINYIKLEPLAGGRGVTWTSVYCLDIGGMIPDNFHT